jgi:hypothetical protein
MGYTMATQDIKIISFETIHAKQKEGQKSAPSRIVAELQTIYSRQLTDLLQRLFAVVDDELFRRSNSESEDLQALYFGAMRQIRVESAAFQANCHARIVCQYGELWKKKALYSPELSGEGLGGSDEQGFSLLEDEALEEEIAVAAMIEKGNSLFQSQLFALNKRMASLLEREDLDLTENPLAPHVLCNAFAAGLKPLRMDLTIKLLIFKLFDQVVLSALGKLYHDLNAFLINEGVLPTLSKNIKRPPLSTLASSPNRGSQGIIGAAEEEPGENQQAYMDVFHGMQRLLDGWRIQMGYSSSFGDEGYSGGLAFDTREVLGALNVIQDPAMAAIESQFGMEGLKSFITGQLLKSQPGETRFLARPDEDTIDMVALIFDFILEDRNLPDPVKGLIARLQIPVVKVAMIEKSFFGRKNHPVRLLLNALAQAGIGLDSVEGVADTPIFKKIETIVNRILDEFDQNVDLFSELLDEFMAFMEKELQRSRIAEERTRQVTQSKEQLHLAKRKIAYEIATRLEGKTTPATVRSFLYNTWKDVLVLAYLRRDRQPDDWENAREVMDKLIWSVLPPRDAAARKAVIQTIPHLLKAIRGGLESISLDPQSVTTALKELEACHVTCFSHPVGETAAHGSGADTAGRQDNRTVEIRDPELAQAIIEIKANLPDIENLTVKDLRRAPEEMSADGHDTGDSIAEDEYLFKARDLEVGEWIEFKDGKKRIRGKLSWKSQVTSTYVFVNRKGAKVLEIALNDLVRKMSDNSARVIENADTPLMDRAFGALMNKLRIPVIKSA